ncbi:peroxidasin homolog isoform X2 [Mya arenaria]|uniref:peroxidasin homolog isoform X2 n=1 Tax=Mya arenaria TaxID=6604 RepID=UPI0022E37B05|nr:peroxidasin homolog isoform X2 [Mya arenaria]
MVPSICIFMTGVCFWITYLSVIQAIVLQDNLAIYLENGNEAPSTVNVIEGTAVNLSCHSPLDQIKYSLAKDGDPLFTVDGAFLVFTSIQRRFNGRYTCTARNIGTAESATISVDLSVIYPPSRPVISGPDIVVLGESFTLFCYADSIPLPNYYWKVATHTVDVIEARGRVYKYTQSASTYSIWRVCYAEVTLFPTVGAQQHHSIFEKKNMIVQEKTGIWSLPEDVRSVVGKTVDVECKVAGAPAPQVWWTKAGNSSFAYQGGRLFIQNVQAYDAGMYTCNAQNTMTPSGQESRDTRDSRDFVLNVENPVFPGDCAECFNPDLTFKITTTTPSNTVTSATVACPSVANQGLIVATVIGWLLAATLFAIGLLFFLRYRQSSTITKTAEQESSKAHAKNDIHSLAHPSMDRQLPVPPYNRMEPEMVADSPYTELYADHYTEPISDQNSPDYLTSV